MKKKLIKKITFLLLSFSLSACSTLGKQQVSEANFTQLAALSGYEINNGFITIKTLGHGCTFYTNYELMLDNLNNNSLKVVQIKADNCKMKARFVSMKYSYRHLGLDLNEKIIVKNPISVVSQSKLVAFK